MSNPRTEARGSFIKGVMLLGAYETKRLCKEKRSCTGDVQERWKSVENIVSGRQIPVRNGAWPSKAGVVWGTGKTLWRIPLPQKRVCCSGQGKLDDWRLSWKFAWWAWTEKEEGRVRIAVQTGSYWFIHSMIGSMHFLSVQSHLWSPAAISAFSHIS